MGRGVTGYDSRVVVSTTVMLVDRRPGKVAVWCRVLLGSMLTAYVSVVRRSLYILAEVF